MSWHALYYKFLLCGDEDGTFQSKPPFLGGSLHDGFPLSVVGDFLYIDLIHRFGDLFLSSKSVYQAPDGVYFFNIGFLNLSICFSASGCFSSKITVDELEAGWFTCWLWSLIIFLTQRSCVSQPCSYPMKTLHPRSMYTLPREGVQRGYPLCGVQGGYPPS
jgi:hypothetical protein